MLGLPSPTFQNYSRQEGITGPLSSSKDRMGKWLLWFPAVENYLKLIYLQLIIKSYYMNVSILAKRVWQIVIV